MIKKRQVTKKNIVFNIGDRVQCIRRVSIPFESPCFAEILNLEQIYHVQGVDNPGVTGGYLMLRIEETGYWHLAENFKKVI